MSVLLTNYHMSCQLLGLQLCLSRNYRISGAGGGGGGVRGWGGCLMIISPALSLIKLMVLTNSSY